MRVAPVLFTRVGLISSIWARIALVEGVAIRLTGVCSPANGIVLCRGGRVVVGGLEASESLHQRAEGLPMNTRCGCSGDRSCSCSGLSRRRRTAS